jgi:putative SOS response-associated peptidase YedK
MCGRFSIVKKAEDIEQRFSAKLDKSQYVINPNASPTQKLLVMTSNNKEEIQFYHWGLMMPWAKELKEMSKLFNLRSETLLEKPVFGNLLQKQRCLVIADAFYEWKKEDKLKTPYRITVGDAKIFCFAGVWNQWKNSGGVLFHTFTIITTQPNNLIKSIHDRMPVILDEKNEKYWLNEAVTPTEAMDFLRPFPENEMSMSIVNDQNIFGRKQNIQKKPDGEQKKLF